jgi:O-antigen/teichoic acid export membrane protein
MFSREMLVVFSTPDYYAAAAIVPLLAAAILLSNMYIFAPGLDIAKRTGVSASVRVAGAGLNTGLNFALIPIWGIWGAALATFLSALLIFAAYMVFSQRLYFVPHAWRPLGLAVLAATGVFLVSTQVQIVAWADIMVRSGLLGVAAWVFTRLGLIEPTEIRRGLGYLWPGRSTSAA